MSNKKQKRMRRKAPWDPLRAAIATDPAMSYMLFKEDCDIWKNSRYTVVRYYLESGMEVLTIRRNDKQQQRRWDDFQRIKNELCGEERYALEVYPAESHKVPVENQYWLWVLPEAHSPGFDPSFIERDEIRPEDWQ